MTQEKLNQTVYWINESDEVESGTYYEFLDQFVDETTTPKGVGPRDFIKFVEIDELFSYINKENLKDESEFVWDAATSLNGEEIAKLGGLWTISTWGVGGNHYKQGNRYYSSEEAAKLEYYKWLAIEWNEKYCVHYYVTEEEAEKELLRIKAEEYGVDIEVYKSIRKKEEFVKDIRNQRAQEEREKEKKRVQELVEIYAKLIEPVKGEKYGDTCVRLSKALKSRIESKVFHSTVKYLRRKAKEEL